METDLFPLDDEELRMLGCLIEKAMTTPDQYPMSLNGIRVACNQVSNRNPIVDYGETTVAEALRRLADKGLAKFVHRTSDRVVKYIHAATDVLELSDQQVSLVAVLTLRGAQTPGELRQRTLRYVDFTGLPEVETTLEGLRGRLVEELDRQPGHKETRWRHLMGSDGEVGVVPPAAPGDDAPPETTDDDTLRNELSELRNRFERLLEALGVDDI